MSGPDLLERVRMCLAEVGEDPMLASEPSAARRAAGARIAYPLLTAEQDKTMWRALEISTDKPPCCWSCFPPQPRQSEAVLAARDACEATRPCMEDCGRDRGES